MEAIADRPKDMWVRALGALKRAEARGDATLLPRILELAAEQPAHPALIGEDTRLDYAGLAVRCRQFAEWGARRGFGPGTVIGLVMENCPDYAAIWLGLTQAGCAVALLNTNLAGEALEHCLRAAECRAVIASPALAYGLGEPDGMEIWVHGMPEAAGSAFHALRLEAGIEADLETAAPPLPAHRPRPQDTALLIYTSGTTGFPKATRITHGRIIEWSHWFAGMMNAAPDDRLYDCLPMYHSVGGVVAIGAMLVAGGAAVIRRRFSASRFWGDVADTGCTIFQYIGELCRYLVNAPPHPAERQHRLRLCCGNGLRADVWERFQARFAIPKILEFYAATEGNVSLYNCDGRPGAIGHVPGFLAHRFPVALIRCDMQTGEPLRGADGLCIRCGPDAPGEAIGAPARGFDGYTDAGASAAKALHDVFKPGDLWFRTGDMMRRDAAGYYYFLDRLGDNFRWKGENVSSTEVATVIGACPGVSEAIVFGVAVPGHEGKAGMAAITIDAGFRMERLLDHLAGKLPGYARPLFLRLCESLEQTATFKLRKEIYAGEAYGPSAGRVWLLDHRRHVAVECDEALRGLIDSGKLEGV